MSSRNRAFLLHLSASACLALCSLVLVFFIWYPAPLQRAVGVTEIFLIVLAVDVILGPCLTWTVARPGKKRRLLMFDLAVIISVQLSALIYGLSTVAEGRPVWLVLNTDRADLVRANEIDARRIDQARPEFRHAPWTGPRWVFAEGPTDLKEQNDLLMESALGGSDLYQRPEYYLPIDDPRRLPMLAAKAQALDKLKQFNPAEDVARELARYPNADAWLPLMCNVEPMTVLINKESGTILGIVDLAPWP